MSYDAIVVGSGIGGMTSAIILAKEGQNVLVLEQFARPGGLTQTFRRKGLTFPTGVHCLGSLDEGQVLHQFFKYAGVLDRIDLVPMASEGFLQCCYGDESYYLPHNKTAFRRKMVDYFGQPDVVDRFLADMASVVATFNLYNLSAKRRPMAADPQHVSLQEYLDQLTSDRRLQAALSAVWPMYGLLPNEAPIYVHFLVMDSFLNGAYRIDESRTPLVGALVDALEAAGGQVRCGARVVAIDCPNRVVKGVRLSDGQFVPAKRVIFTAHPRSIPEFCSSGVLRPAFCGRLQAAQETCGVFGVALSWPADRCPMAECDVSLHADILAPSDVSRPLFGTTGSPTMIYCSAQPRSVDGRRAVVAMCVLDEGDVRDWTDTRTGHRPSGYTEAKTELAGRIVSILRRKWPQIGQDVEILDTFTPLSFRDYTASPTGSAYGIKKTVRSLRGSRFGPATRVRELYLAGQSIDLSGVVGTVICSINACGMIVGLEHLCNRIAKESL